MTIETPAPPSLLRFRLVPEAAPEATLSRSVDLAVLVLLAFAGGGALVWLLRARPTRRSA